MNLFLDFWLAYWRALMAPLARFERQAELVTRKPPHLPAAPPSAEVVELQAWRRNGGL